MGRTLSLFGPYFLLNVQEVHCQLTETGTLAY
jgi:hypothetical protein